MERIMRKSLFIFRANYCAKSQIFWLRLPRRSLATVQTENSCSSENRLKSAYDAVIVGAGHNGLVSAAYLQKAGLDVCVLERRHIVGGAACTEEIVPGFKFSRASYVLSLLRPQVLKDLELKKHGLKLYFREPHSYTPLLEPKGKARSLTLAADEKFTTEQLAQFSVKDAEAYFLYEAALNKVVDALDPLLDETPLDLNSLTKGSVRDRLENLPALRALLKLGRQLGSHHSLLYELMTASSAKVLNKWFESEPLKATLNTDAVIGAMLSPYQAGSGYVLLHHVCGNLEGRKGAWAYVEGGMGAVSEAIANSAKSHGAHIFTNKEVAHVTADSGHRVTGVVLQDGTEVKAKAVLSNATAAETYLRLTSEADLPESFIKAVREIDYTSPVTKINVAVDRLPNFTADPNTRKTEPMPHHQATIHVNCENSALLHEAFTDAVQGRPSSRPLMEMTMPSSLDPTIAPPGCHVLQLFTQYTPYTLANGQQWTEETKDAYADRVFDCIENYAPGFKKSVVGRDILTPVDLEKTFRLTGGNIFHGSMGLDQLYSARPLAECTGYRSPLAGLYLCGSGAHPGGGVMGAAGRLAALTVIKDLKKS